MPKQNQSKMFNRYQLDQTTGLTLCEPCWNGAHYIKWETNNELGRQDKPKKIIVDKGGQSNCLQGQCECPCIALREEKPKRVSKHERDQYAKEHQAVLPL